MLQSAFCIAARSCRKICNGDGAPMARTATRGRSVSADERRQIAALVKAGQSVAEIAKKLHRPYATIQFYVPEHLRSGALVETVYIEQRQLSAPIDTWA